MFNKFRDEDYVFALNHRLHHKKITFLSDSEHLNT
jgi:hypothetical protein